MAILTTGNTFADGDQVTAAALNTATNSATFASGAVDNASTQLSGGAIILKDGGVTTAKLKDGGVTTAKLKDGGVTTAKLNDASVTTAKLNDASVTTAKLNASAVTLPKMENRANMTVIGNVSGGVTAPTEVSILDEDNLASNSATALATQQSIKTYIDTLFATRIFTNSYNSSEITFPAADTSLTVSHGLGVAPKIYQVLYKCKTAEYGYSVNDEVIANGIDSNGFMGVWANNSTVGFRFNINPYVIRRDIATYGILTAAKWKIVFKAYA